MQAVLPDGTRVSPDGKTTLHIGGWTNAWAAFQKAKEVYAEEDGAYGGMFGLGEPNTAYAKYFVGNSYLKPLTDPKKTVFLANVTFEPKCRNNSMRQAEAGKFCCVWTETAGIRRKAKRQERFIREM